MLEGFGCASLVAVDRLHQQLHFVSQTSGLAMSRRALSEEQAPAPEDPNVSEQRINGSLPFNPMLSGVNSRAWEEDADIKPLDERGSGNVSSRA